MRAGQLRQVTMVSAWFPPNNSTGGHRVRLVAPHLAEFGYEPTVVTIRPDRYEGNLDPELAGMLPQSLQVVCADALPTQPIRLVGDPALRSFLPTLRVLRRLRRRRRMDLLFITIFPAYSALLGPIMRWSERVPFILDYQDPWVYPILPSERRSWKARVSHWLADALEPWVLKRVDGLSAVSDSYFDPIVARNPHLARVPKVAFPLGGEIADHEYIEMTKRQSTCLNRQELIGKRVFVYAGTFWPPAEQTFRALLTACRDLRTSDPEAKKTLHLLFVGTGSRPEDPTSAQVMPLARELGATEFVTEIANRQPFLEALATLHRSHAVLILGSTDRHYTASKTFQALMSSRPVVAALHEASSAVEFLARQKSVQLITYSDNKGVGTTIAEMMAAVRRTLAIAPGVPVNRDPADLELFSARTVAGRLAGLFDQVLGGCQS